MAQRIHVVINPASGRPMPILHTLNSVFHQHGYEWDISITKNPGDGLRFAQQAVADGVDIVAAYGGDGTVAEVASGLIGTDTPLAILPGGTANVMSIELGIPNDLAGACTLICGDQVEARWVDMGKIGDTYFLLRAGIGFEAAMVQEAGREAKEGMGVLAYLLSALGNLRNPAPADYRINLDGRTVESQGMTCIIANSGNMGRQGINMMPEIKIDDGLLDIIVVRQADIRTLLAFTANVTGIAQPVPVTGSADRETLAEEATKALQHWQGKEVEVISSPVQPVQSDGEMIGETPVRAHVLPRAIQILSPLVQTA